MPQHGITQNFYVVFYGLILISKSIYNEISTRNTLIFCSFTNYKILWIFTALNHVSKCVLKLKSLNDGIDTSPLC